MKEFTRDADKRGVQLDQVNAFDRGMTERLRDGATGAAAIMRMWRGAECSSSAYCTDSSAALRPASWRG